MLSLLPVSGVLHMAYFNHSDVSDHLVYAATPGILALAAAWLTRPYEHGGAIGHAALIVMGGLVITLGIGCCQRADEFSRPEKLWRSNLEVNPHSFAAHKNLGLYFLELAKREPGVLILADGYFHAAMKSDDKDRSAAVNLANIMGKEGRWPQSAALYEDILKTNPEAESYNNYGVALLEIGETAKAQEAFQNALRLTPTMESACFNSTASRCRRTGCPKLARCCGGACGSIPKASRR